MASSSLIHLRWSVPWESSTIRAGPSSLDQDSTLIAVIEMSQSRWLVGGLVPGLNREPKKGVAPDAEGLLWLLHRWRDEAIKAGCRIERLCVAYEAGRVPAGALAAAASSAM
jgi:hypothetical protein